MRGSTLSEVTCTMKSFAYLAVAAMVLLELPLLFARSSFAVPNPGVLNAQDKAFLNQAAESMRAEVALGRLTTYRSSRPRVKDFGRQMIVDHERLERQLQALAQGLEYRLPEHPDARQTSQKDQLAVLTGTQFDRDYLQYMMTDHGHDVSNFKREIDSGENPQLKVFAEQNLPAVEQHLRVAQSLFHVINGQEHWAVGS